MKKIDKAQLTFITQKREKRRLKRLRGPSLPKKTYGPVNITIPSVLNLDDNRTEFLALIKKIQDVILGKKRFRIDHRKMSSVTEEALLVLTAEIERCTSITGVKLQGMYKLFPKNIEVKNLLHKIGYWNYFHISSKETKIDSSISNQTHLKMVSDTEATAETIGNLIDFFENIICFDAPTKEKFSDAMLEAAANTVEHAYIKEQPVQPIKKWWLTATIEHSKDQISFVFYDQGLGILNTLESSRSKIRFKRLMAGWLKEDLSKGGILRKLVTTNLSKHSSERRGNGLISFKKFIDEVEGGELTIYTDNVSYSTQSDTMKKYSDNVDGTLIVWKITPNHESNRCIYIK